MENLSKKTSSQKSDELEVVNSNVAGIDIGSTENWVSVSPNVCQENIRCFGSYTEDLYQIADWLEKCSVKSVVMESTGIYWVPLYEVLEEKKIGVLLCNASYAKNLPGRKKTDKYDCDWLRKLHSYGMLNSSFIPEKSIRELKSVVRYREKLTKDKNIHIQRMQKALTLMNFYLHKVISDITGKTGLLIINAIINGQTDPYELLKYKDPGIKTSEEEIIKALKGSIKREHVFLLKRSLEYYNFVLNQISLCDSEISTMLSDFEVLPFEKFTPKKKTKKIAKRLELTKVTGVDLCEIPGIDVLSLEKLLSETGLDMSKWENSKHFTSWIGLSPNNKITGGKVFQNKTNRVKSKVSEVFRMCASAVKNSKNHLGEFYRRKKAQKGEIKAIVATARKIAVYYYTILKTKTPYNDLGEEHYKQKEIERFIKALTSKAKKFGLNVNISM